MTDNIKLSRRCLHVVALVGRGQSRVCQRISAVCELRTVRVLIAGTQEVVAADKTEIETCSWGCKKCHAVIDVATPLTWIGKFALYTHTKNHPRYRNIRRETFDHTNYYTLKGKVVRPGPVGIDLIDFANRRFGSIYPVTNSSGLLLTNR